MNKQEAKKALDKAVGDYADARKSCEEARKACYEAGKAYFEAGKASKED